MYGIRPSWRYLTTLASFLLLLLVVPAYLDLNFNGLHSIIFGPQKVSRFQLSPLVHSSRPPDTRTYNLTLRAEHLSPNGVLKTVYTVNGLFPGPTIEARSGDILVVNVHNQLSEGTSLHWHGIRHSLGSNSQDGASGVTQCPIPPGGNYTYRIQLSPEQSGTFWYHSHDATQRADGLFGALIIHPAQQFRPPQDELRGLRSRALEPVPDFDQVMTIGDWYHRSGKEVADWYQSLRSQGNEPVPDAILNNGQQAFNCSKSLAKITCDPTKGRIPSFTLHPQRRNVLRFINSGSIAEIHLSLDSHLFRVIEADGTNIEPIDVKELAIAPGQRYAVEVIRVMDVSDTATTFWLRQRVNYEDFMYPNPALDLESKSIISYGTRRISRIPTSSRWSDNGIHENEVLDPLALQPMGQSARVLPPAEGAVMMYVTTMKRTSTKGKPFGYVNQTTWKPDLARPVLARDEAVSSKNELIFPVNLPDRNTDLSSSSTSPPATAVVLDIIVNNLEDGPHPFHLHGHHFWPLYTYEARIGAGSYRWDRPPTLPTTAPALRDTFVIPPKGHAVFRVKFDTPGMWLFHCHVLVHLQSGMAMIFNVFNDRIPQEDRASAVASCSTS